MDQFVVIGISGKIGSGKDYVADQIRSYFTQDIIKVCFADQLKLAVMAKHDVSFSDMMAKPYHVRRLLQQEGTESRALDPRIWVKYLQGQILLQAQRGVKMFILSDVRYVNELEFVQSFPNHLVIRVSAPLRNAARLLKEESNALVQTHESETQLDYLDAQPNSSHFLKVNNDGECPIISIMEKVQEIRVNSKLF